MKKHLSKFNFVAADTNIFIYYFQKHPRFGPIVRDLFRSFSFSKTAVYTSSISLTELLSVKIASELIDKLQYNFFSIPLLNIVPVDNDIAITAASIRRGYNFSLSDSIQLATAKISKVQVFITNDKNLVRFKELPIRLLTAN